MVQHNIVGDLICSNTTIGTSNLVHARAHTQSFLLSCAKLEQLCMKCLSIQNSMSGKRAFILIKAARIYKTKF